MVLDLIDFTPAQVSPWIILAAGILVFIESAMAKWPVIKKFYLFSITISLSNLCGSFLIIIFLGKFFFQDVPYEKFAWLAAIFVPTDNKLYSGLFHHPYMPDRIKQLLHIEALSNQTLAICLGFIFFYFFFKKNLLFTLGISVLLVAAAGVPFAFLIYAFWKKEYIPEKFLGYIWIIFACVLFIFSQYLAESGFLTMLLFGIFLGHKFRFLCRPLMLFAAREGNYLYYLIIFLFSISYLSYQMMHLHTNALYLGLLLPLLIRAAAFLGAVLRNSGYQKPTFGFISWFGPKGMLSLALAAQFIWDASEPWALMVWTVFFSIWIYGITTLPAASLYMRFLRRQRAEDLEEEIPAVNLPLGLHARDEDISPFHNR
ncbi:MAG: hypothetical protein Tsb0015_02500 [Simkaniaceae bacterium]